MYKLVKSEMKKHREWSIDSAAIGVAWLDDQVQNLKKINVCYVNITFVCTL